MAWSIHTWPQQATFHVVFDVHVLKLNLSWPFLTGVFLIIQDYDVNINNMYMVVAVTIQYCAIVLQQHLPYALSSCPTRIQVGLTWRHSKFPNLYWTLEIVHMHWTYFSLQTNLKNNARWSNEELTLAVQCKFSFLSSKTNFTFFLAKVFSTTENGGTVPLRPGLKDGRTLKMALFCFFHFQPFVVMARTSKRWQTFCRTRL